MADAFFALIPVLVTGMRAAPRPRRGRVSSTQGLHVSLNRSRFKDKNMQQFKVLQRPLRVRHAAL
ncbi:hypothetical protein FKV68_11585 [Sinorhizobium mexicanum]|uniref:Uncharacterized protein n=1 Tax=Sinorhizobium mexicanum TaxID=375549 RepID=A0A859QD93_9HYPH|nr:hypothetical protein FKV68_11585 [Sinorhizobium mexicanum]